MVEPILSATAILFYALHHCVPDTVQLTLLRILECGGSDQLVELGLHDIVVFCAEANGAAAHSYDSQSTDGELVDEIVWSPGELMMLSHNLSCTTNTQCLGAT